MSFLQLRSPRIKNNQAYSAPGGGTTTVAVTKALQYTVKTTPTAPAKPLKYATRVTPSAKSLALKYAVKATLSAVTKSLQYKTTAATTPPVLVQSATGHTADNAFSEKVSVTMGSALTVGNTLIVIAANSSNNAETFTLTDTLGNTFTKYIDASNTTDASSVRLFYSVITTGGSGDVLTFLTNPNDFANRTIIALEFSGLNTSSLTDGFTTNPFDGYTQTYTGSNLTTTNANDLLIGFVVGNTSASVLNSETGQGWGSTLIQDGAVQFDKLGVQYKYVTSTGTYHSSMFDTAQFMTGVVGIAAFRAATAQTTNTIAVTKNLKYATKTTPSALTKVLKYTTRKTPTALTKPLKYATRVTPSALSKSLKYTTRATPTALTKGLKYTTKTTHSLTKTLLYDIRTNHALTKLLAYDVKRTVTALTKPLKYTARTTSALSKILGYRIKSNIALTKGLKYTTKTASALTKPLKYSVKVAPAAITKALRYANKTTNGRRNLIKNPSFEADTVGANPLNWTNQNTNGTITSKGVANDWAQIGTNSIKIAMATSGTQAYIQNITAVIGQTYTFSGYIKTDANVTNAALVIYDNGATSEVHIGANQQGRYSVTRTVNGTGTITLVAGIGQYTGGASAGTAWFDALQLELGSTATPYFDGSMPGSSWTGTANASASVNNFIALPLAYTVRKSLSLTKGLIYDIRRTPSALTKSLKYTTKAASALTKPLKYNTTGNNNTVKTLPLKYTLKTITKLTKSLRYAIINRAAIAFSYNLKYTVKTTKTPTKALTYDTRRSVALTKPLKYTIKKSISLAKSLKYTTLKPAAITKPLKYTVKTTRALTKALKYSVKLPSISLTKALKYALITHSIKTAPLRYAVKTPHSATKSLRYTLTRSRPTTKPLNYVISTRQTSGTQLAVNQQPGYVYLDNGETLLPLTQDNHGLNVQNDGNSLAVENKSNSIMLQ